MNVRDQGSGIRDQGSGIRDQGSGIRAIALFSPNFWYVLCIVWVFPRGEAS
ncbi:MAG: hypothetical protein LBI62_07430 [Candidatus Accumulibacter sp.]|nr:hypothetical protein [Accumulibacter sp.]